MGHYKHLSTEERETAMVLQCQGASIRAIARMLGRSPSTLSRELRRNSKTSGAYSAAYADKLYRRRRKRCCRPCILSDQAISAYIMARIREEKWSPEQIAAHSKLTGSPVSFSYATIYRAIHRRLLPASIKKHMRLMWHYKRRKKKDKRSEMQGIRKISERPESVDRRETVGHWEGDTILGQRKTGAIGTFVERKTGYLIAFLLNGGSSKEYLEKASVAFASLPSEAKQTLTVDRGKEFTLHREIEEQLGFTLYFCDPYRPWQKGCVENANFLLRQFFPKKTSFASITPEELQRVVDLINNRPRKRLAWSSPAQVFSSSLLHLD